VEVGLVAGQEARNYNVQISNVLFRITGMQTKGGDQHKEADPEMDVNEDDFEVGKAAFQIPPTRRVLVSAASAGVAKPAWECCVFGATTCRRKQKSHCGEDRLISVWHQMESRARGSTNHSRGGGMFKSLRNLRGAKLLCFAETSNCPSIRLATSLPSH